MKAWYVVSTLPNQEVRAQTNLVRQGFRPWLPMMKRSRRHARKLDTVQVPLFAGYLFVELDVERERWSPINGTFGVRKLLSQGDRPVPVPHDFVEALSASLDDDGTVKVPAPALRPGQKVRMIAGPFVDCVATLINLASADRIAVLLNVLGRDVSTVVSSRMVAPAG